MTFDIAHVAAYARANPQASTMPSAGLFGSLSGAQAQSQTTTATHGIWTESQRS
jgi:hypothetical protein